MVGSNLDIGESSEIQLNLVISCKIYRIFVLLRRKQLTDTIGSVLKKGRPRWPGSSPPLGLAILAFSTKLQNSCGLHQFSCYCYTKHSLKLKSLIQIYTTQIPISSSCSSYFSVPTASLFFILLYFFLFLHFLFIAWVLQDALQNQFHDLQSSMNKLFFIFLSFPQALQKITLHTTYVVLKYQV